MAEFKENTNVDEHGRKCIIELQNVKREFHVGSETVRALRGVSFKIHEGEFVTIMGTSGSGKSTLVSLISRLYDVTSGAVRVGGVDVREYDQEGLRNNVAVVLQKNVLFSGTIKENLRWGNPEATDEEMEHACRLACAHDFITSFPDGYDTHIEQGGTNVSGGQKQRLTIARALVMQPEILILDDSASALDYATDAALRKEIRGLQTTVFVVSQRASSVRDADKIIVLDDGKAVGIGTHAQLMENCEVYREIYFSQYSEEREVDT